MKPVPIFRRPTFLLALLGCCLALVVTQGDLGSVDTVARYQAARWLLWGESPIVPTVYQAIGPSGVAHHPYGFGQTLLMIPLELIVAMITDDRHVRMAAVSLAMQMMLTALAAVGSFRVLQQFGVSQAVAARSTVVLLLATSLLHYVQFAQENLLILACVVWGIGFLLAEDQGNAFWGGTCFGMVLLTRPTSLLLVLPLLLALLWNRRERWLATILALIPFGLTDRWYQWARFGDLSHHYMSFVRPFADEHAPPDWPWSGDVVAGLLGPLVWPNASIFLFDPLLVAVLVGLIVGWKQVDVRLRSLFVGLASSLVATIVFHAKFYTFAGEVSWGDRFTATTVHLLLLLGLPLAMRFGWRFRCVCGIAGMVQILSVLLIPGVESLQTASQPAQFEIGLRLQNVLAVIQGMELPGVPRLWQTINLLPWLGRSRRPELWQLASLIWAIGVVGVFVAMFGIVRISRDRLRDSVLDH